MIENTNPNPIEDKTNTYAEVQKKRLQEIKELKKNAKTVQAQKQVNTVRVPGQKPGQVRQQ